MTCLLLAVGALALAGCSSTPSAKVDKGPIAAKTFSFVSAGAKPAPAYADGRAEVHALVQDAITRNLAFRGIQRVESGGDVTVGYLVIVGDNASTAMINDYFDYGGDAAGLQERAQKGYTSSKNPDYFRAGTLVIDITDAKTYKLLKRGHATRSLLANPTQQARAAVIKEVVDEILADLRVK